MQVADAAAQIATASAAVGGGGFWGQIAGLVAFVLVSLVSTWAMLSKTTRDQRFQLEMLRAQHEIAAAERKAQIAEERAARDVSAAQIRERLVADSASVQQSLAATGQSVTATALELKEDTRLVTALQTLEIKAAIEAAREFTAARADAAFKESNGVNEKIRKLSEAHQAQGAVLERLLRTIEASQKKAAGA